MDETAVPMPAYAEPETGRVRRVALAVIICGFAACVLVTLIGIVWLFGLNFFEKTILGQSSRAFVMFDDGTFGQGLAIAAMAASFNWWFGYLTIPAAMLVLGVTIGRFPKRKITEPLPYLRWGAISGAVLVAGPSLFGVTVLASQQVQIPALFGGLVGGGAIGALAGLACAGLFLLIVKPKTQIRSVDTSIF